MIISVICGKGSPGASTAALGMTLCWPRPVLLVEADPAGGSLALGYAAGADVGGRSLTGVRVAARRSGMAPAIWANVVTLGENRWLLPGVDTTQQAATIDYPALASALAGLGVDVIIDAGRIPAPVRHDALWAAADVVIVATRSTLPSVHSAQIAAAVAREAIGATGPVLQSVIVGASRPYSERDIRAAMADISPVAGVLAWDPAAAGALADARPAPRAFASSPLMRSAARLAKSIAQQAELGQVAAGQTEGAAAKQGRAGPAASASALTGDGDASGSGLMEADWAEHERAASAAIAYPHAGGHSQAPVHRADAAASSARHTARAPAAATVRTGGTL